MKRRHGFTLIELLIVIAIIAILVAVLVPVFFKVKESARQGTAMENLKLIGQGLAAYKLENHHPPAVLFGYVDTAATGGTGTLEAPKLKVSPGTAPYGLYPSYVKSADTFEDPNNSVDKATVEAIGLPTCIVSAPCYYAADAYDLSPQVSGGSSLNTTNVLRYRTVWEQPPVPPATPDANYPRQLQFPNPPGDTYVTCTTYHVPNADKVLVLFENGSVKKMTGADFAAQDTTPPPTTPPTPGNFWTVRP